jgi:hypothetical protein
MGEVRRVERVWEGKGGKLRAYKLSTEKPLLPRCISAVRRELWERREREVRESEERVEGGQIRVKSTSDSS